jgi:hypothetical protein
MKVDNNTTFIIKGGRIMDRRFVLYIGSLIITGTSFMATFYLLQGYANITGVIGAIVFAGLAFVLDICCKLSCGMEGVDRVKKKDYASAILCFAISGASIFVSIFASQAFFKNMENELAQQTLQSSDVYKDNRTLLNNKQKEVKAIESIDSAKLLEDEKQKVLNDLEEQKNNLPRNYRTRRAEISNKIAALEKDYNVRIAKAAEQKQTKIAQINKDVERLSGKEFKTTTMGGITAAAGDKNTDDLFEYLAWFLEIANIVMIFLVSGTPMGEKLRMGNILKALPAKAATPEAQKKTPLIVDLTKKKTINALPDAGFKKAELTAYIKRCWDGKEIGSVADGYKRICKDIGITPTLGGKIRGHLEQIGALEASGGSTIIKKEMREII